MENKSPRHVIDMIFPLALLAVFAIAAMTVLLVSSNLYTKTHHRFQANTERYDALFYISEKLHQNDSRGSVYIQEVDGVSCLSFDMLMGEDTYTTYIYAYEGFLCELVARKDVAISLRGGQSVMPVSGLRLELLSDHLILMEVTDMDGQISSMIAGERSAP